MTMTADPYRERLQQAMERMTALREALAAERARSRAPVAVLGLGCRLPPAVHDPDAFFAGLLAGDDGVGPAPAARFGAEAPELPQGGYLADVRGFDAAFFGVSPREAAAMDPQHRLLLEVVWEALERAGLPPERLPGDRVGVFLGVAGGDYLPRALADAPDMFALTGNGGAFASGRLAYSLGFRGPCLAVDTACSSSLVAAHLAVQSLRRGECDVAVVAAVSVVSEVAATRLLLRSGALASDGRCKSFDAAADGFARAEGAVAVVLQRLDDARRGEAPVLAVLRGSAINQDGRSSGLTAPNVEAQRAMLTAALADAGVEADSVGYVETHGTGTALGDPIEFDALRAVFGRRRGAMPCVLGAVKSNVGHLEAAAGLVGLLKAIGCLRAGRIPKNLHFTRPNPHLELAGTPFVLPAVTVEFPAGEGPRRAGLSAFGMSGTNAHLVLEQAPADLASPRSLGSPTGSPLAADVIADGEPCLLTLSARHPDALVALADATADAIEAGQPARAVARTMALHRSHHPHRLALTFAASDGVASALRCFARGDATMELEVGEGSRRDSPVFVCAGQGTAWPGMGRALLAMPAARAVLEHAAAVVAEHGGFDLLATLCDLDAPLRRTELAQPAIVAVTLAIAAALEVHGVRPAAVIGHSVGELAAAHLAGALSRAEALRLACVRGRVMQRSAGAGAMVAVALAPATAAAEVAGEPGLELAAFNGPQATVIGGDEGAIAALIVRLAASGVRCRRLDVDHAFHTAAMDPALPLFAAAVGASTATDLRCALYSTVTGASVAGSALGVAHWQAGIRRPVRLDAALQAAVGDGHRLFLELGPHPILGGGFTGDDHRVVATLRRGDEAGPALVRALGALYVEGSPVDLAPLHATRGTVVAAPTYPWQRRDHWIARAHATEHAHLDDSASGDADSDDNDAHASGHADRDDRGHAQREDSDAHAGGVERHLVERRVRAEIAAVLRLPPDEPISARRGLFELGFDSLLSVELARRLARAFDRPLGSTLVFEHPTLAALVDHLCDVARVRPQARRSSVREPIAILGMACRFPGGANDPDAFWELLRAGRDGTSEVPADRWDRDAFFDPDPQAPGKMYVTRAGFLQGVDVRAFDAACFNISPAEARSLDPQQRLLLELTWEALEDAGRPFDRLEGTRTGIYVGIATSDYGQLLARRPLTEFDPYLATGCAMNTAAGRLAYVLGARGPTLALDTACSSSLVAAHLAIESLRRGEIDLALVAGTNLMLDPAIGVMYSRMGGLAPDGRCKAFDAAADGMVRGEGAAVLVLARRSDADRSRDRVLAVIRGAAVNHDGRASGLTVPSGPAQQAVIREALADAGVLPAAIDYVETHGTGTSLGDPIEANALIAALGPGRGPERPLILGSAKANVGHLEPAAGLVGLIKVVQAMRHRTIPPQPTFTGLNPAIRPGDVRLVVPTEPLPWTGARLAGVSSFGISGTNAHLIVEASDEAEPVAARAPDVAAASEPVAARAPDVAVSESAAFLLPISARSVAGLDVLAGAWEARLADPDAPVADLCAAAALRRAHLPHRLTVAGRDRPGLLAALDAWRAGDAGHPGWAAGHSDGPARLAFVFSGHGGHWVGMGRALLAGDPIFARAFHDCEAALARLSPGTSLLAALTAADAEDRWRSKSVLHPLMLALQVSTAAVWLLRWGVAPAAIVGHSSGELAAAVVAGALPLDDAFRVSLARCAMIERIVGQGAMAVVGLPPEALEVPLADFGGRVTIAVHNAPRQAVISGDNEAIAALGRRFAAANVFFRMIPGADGAGHSHHFDPHLPELRAALAGLRPGPARFPFYSTVTAGALDGASLGADYWAANLRQRVRFAETAAQLGRDGIAAFLEIGPHPVLLAAIAQIAPSAVTVASMTRDADELLALRAALGRLQVAGVELDWDRIHPGGSPALSLPRHPWHRETHWMPPALAPRDTGRHPLIQRELRLARSGERVVEGQLDLGRQDLPPPRMVQGEPVLAPAVLLEFVRVALGDAGTPVDLTLGPAVPFTRRVDLQLCLADAGTFELFARADEAAWQRLGGGRTQIAPAVQARGVVLASPPLDLAAVDARGVVLASPPLDLAAVQARCAALDDGHRERQQARGLALSPALDVIDRVWRGEREALARLRPLGGQWAATAAIAGGLELLAAQVFAADAFPVVGELFWPQSLAEFTPPTAIAAWLHVALRGEVSDVLGASGDVTLFDGVGHVVGALRGVRLTPPDRGLARLAVAAQLGRWAHTLEWEPLAATHEDLEGDAPIDHRHRDPLAAQVDAQSVGAALEPGIWALLADAGGAASSLADCLHAHGHRTLVIPRDDPRPLAELLREARRRGALHGVIDLRWLEQTDEAAVVALLACTRTLVADGAPRLAILTRGAMAVRPGEAPDPAAAMAWALGRTIGMEHLELRVRLLDLDPTQHDLAAVARDLVSPDREDLVAWRAGRRRAARLVPLVVPAPAEPLRIDPDGTWLVTGGLGGVGLQLARWLAERGARHLLLTGRHGLAAAPATPQERERTAVVEALRAADVAVEVVAVDVADEPAMRALLATIPADRPLRGVFHAAGVTHFEPLATTSPATVHAVLRAKVAGARVLDRLTRDLDLGAFVCFSSAAATWGAAGLGVYAAANHFLDLLAHRRRADGLPALTIAWGGWAGGGMSGSATLAYAAQMGLLASPAQHLLEAMDACMQAGLTQLTLADVDWQRFKAVLEARGERPLLRKIEVAVAVTGDGPLARQLAGTAVASRWPTLLAAIARRVAEVLGVRDPADLDHTRGFFQMGMDSMMAVRLRRALEQDTGAGLPATLALEQPTVARLAAWLAREVLGVAPDAAPAPPIEAADDAASEAADERSEAELEALLAAELGEDHRDD